MSLREDVKLDELLDSYERVQNYLTCLKNYVRQRQFRTELESYAKSKKDIDVVFDNIFNDVKLECSGFFELIKSEFLRMEK